MLCQGFWSIAIHGSTLAKKRDVSGPVKVQSDIVTHSYVILTWREVKTSYVSLERIETVISQYKFHHDYLMRISNSHNEVDYVH